MEKKDEEKRVIAIIPARSGSKGLPNKNIKMLNGKPLIAYTIEAALASGICDEVHVSTDSQEYLDIAKQYGAADTFLRDSSLANDDSSTWDLVKDILDKYLSLGKNYYYIILLQPTSPLRTSEQIREAFSLMIEKQETIVSVCEAEHSPLWYSSINEEGALPELVENLKSYSTRQALPTFYRLNGAIYIIKSEQFLRHYYRGYNPIGDGCFAYTMCRTDSVDIDTQIDFDIAEMFMKERERNEIL